MSYTSRIWLNRLANLALASGLLLVLLPWGMRAYGQLSQSIARQRFERRGAALASGEVRPDVFAPALLEIPALGLKTVVTEGSWNWQWLSGALHQPGTAAVGAKGNCVIAGHRNMWDAVFERLPELKPGDKIHLTTGAGAFTYWVEWSRETSARNRAPLMPSTSPTLTLYTCVLPYRDSRRWVVRARLLPSFMAGDRR